MSRNAEPVRYMDRTRDYYRALGYDKDYAWAHFDEVPFARLAKPLREIKMMVTMLMPSVDHHLLSVAAHTPDSSGAIPSAVRKKPMAMPAPADRSSARGVMRA